MAALHFDKVMLWCRTISVREWVRTERETGLACSKNASNVSVQTRQELGKRKWAVFAGKIAGVGEGSIFFHY